MIILSSRRFTILVLLALGCQLPMRLQVLRLMVKTMVQWMLTVQTIGGLTKTTSVIISGQTAVRQLLSTSLLRAIAITVMVGWETSATPVTIGRRFRTAGTTVATCTPHRATWSRCTTSVGLMGTRRVQSQNRLFHFLIDWIYLQAA